MAEVLGRITGSPHRNSACESDAIEVALDGTRGYPPPDAKGGAGGLGRGCDRAGLDGLWRGLRVVAHGVTDADIDARRECCTDSIDALQGEAASASSSPAATDRPAEASAGVLSRVVRGAWGTRGSFQRPQPDPRASGAHSRPCDLHHRVHRLVRTCDCLFGPNHGATPDGQLPSGCS
jgi:hypothetical protein